MTRAVLLLWVWVGVWALAGCTPTWLESGRYACEPGEANQCPGASRCGLEGYCHQLGNTSVAWRCASDDDCEGGFSCGLTRTGEFRECHDPALPQDWPCEQHGDCVAGWRCGFVATGDSRQCHDPALPRAFFCEFDTDCVAEWSCGLAANREERECHDPANPRAWACAEDTDCLSWRCGAEQLCVDPSTDALGVTPPVAIDGGVHLNPLGSRSPVTMLSVSPSYAQDPGRGRANLAFVQDGHLWARSLDTTTGRFKEIDLGTDLPTALIAQGARGIGFEEDPDELERVSATWPDGGLSTFTFLDGGLDHRLDGPDFVNSVEFPMNRLSHGSSTGLLVPSVFGFSSRPKDFFARIHGDYPIRRSLYMDDWTNFKDVPHNRIRAITSLRHREDLECFFLVDDRGLWVSQEGSGGLRSSSFEPVSIDRFSQTECGAGPQPRITSVAAVQDRWLAVTAATPGGPAQVAVLDAERTKTPLGIPGTSYCSTLGTRFNGVPLACGPTTRIQVDVALGPCVACPAGTTFQKMSTVVGALGTQPELEVLCEQTQGAGSVFRLARTGTATDCSRTLVTGESSFFVEPAPQPSEPVPGVVAWGGSAGQIWIGSSTAELASFAFDRAPTGVVRRGAGPDDIIAFTPRLIGTPTPGLGLFSARSSVLSAPVMHGPSLALSGTQLVDLAGTTALSEGRPLAFVSGGTPGTSMSAVLTRSSQGAPLAVVSVGTALFAGDVEAVLSGSGPAVALTQRLTTGEPVSSLAFPRAQPSGAGPLASGYAVTGSLVVRLVADTLTRWRTEAVQLPVSLLPRSTWFQGTRARVGFHDGSVFSLPSRVRISDPLPGGEAVDYAQACGQQLALAPGGLFRLESNAARPVGSWQPIPLPAEVAALDFTDGRVHGVGNEVFVFTRSGEAARITFESCPDL